MATFDAVAWQPRRRSPRSASCAGPRRHFGEDADTLRASKERRQSLLDKSAQFLTRTPLKRTSTLSSASTKSPKSNSTSREGDPSWNSLDELLDLVEDSKERHAAASTRVDADLPATPPLPLPKRLPLLQQVRHERLIAWEAPPEAAAAAASDEQQRSGSAATPSTASSEEATPSGVRDVSTPPQFNRQSVTHALATWALEEMTRTTSGELDQDRAKILRLEERCELLEQELSSRTQEVQSMQMQFTWWQKELSLAEEEQRRLEQESRDLQEELAATRQLAAEQQQREEVTCVVCLDSSATHVVVPCGHLALCETCHGLEPQSSVNSCPVCRRPRSMMIKLFKP